MSGGISTTKNPSLAERVHCQRGRVYDVEETMLKSPLNFTSESLKVLSWVRLFTESKLAPMTRKVSFCPYPTQVYSWSGSRAVNFFPTIVLESMYIGVTFMMLLRFSPRKSNDWTLGKFLEISSNHVLGLEFVRKGLRLGRWHKLRPAPNHRSCLRPSGQSMIRIRDNRWACVHWEFH